MALPKNYLWVTIGKLTIRNNSNAPNGAPKFLLADLIGSLRGPPEQETKVRVFQNEDRRMWCGPVDDGEAFYSFLLQTGDKNVSDVAYIDFETNVSRDGGKLESEGSHYCSHVLIHKEPDVAGRHLIIIEKVPGITFSTIKAHFNWALSSPNLHKNFLSGGVSKSYRGITELDGYQSKTVQQAMTTGTVLDLQFVGAQIQDAGIDEVDLVREASHEVKWSVKRTVDNAGAQTLLQRGIEFLRGWEDVEQDGSQLLVRIKAETGQIRTTEIPVEAGELEEATVEALGGAFYLNEIINNFDVPLTQRYDNLRQDVTDKMRAKALAMLGA